MSNTPALINLLHYWSLLQPDRCRVIDCGTAPLLEVDIGVGHWQLITDPLGGIDAGLIVLAIQIAIIKENWVYTSYSNGISIIALHRDELIERCAVMGHGPADEALAIAALSAYLEVVQVVMEYRSEERSQARVMAHAQVQLPSFLK